MLYSPRVSTVLSLEFLGKSANVNKLRNALTVNGSLGNSPAATAYYLSLAGNDAKALDYLDNVKAHMPHVTPVYPFRTFERTWVLSSLANVGMSIKNLLPEVAWYDLQNELTPEGVGFDATFGIPDGDTSSVCCRILAAAGYDVDPRILAQYEDKERQLFRTYRYERNPSVSTNVHALEALNLMRNYPNRSQVQEEIVAMLLDSRKHNTFWVDKWHASPFYATSHTLVALLNTRPHLASLWQNTVDWIIHTQHTDGSWGYFQKGTVEETSFALTALLHYRRYQPVCEDILHRAAAYLAQNYKGEMTVFPPMWIVKCLYSPTDIVRSIVLAALILYEETFGKSLSA
jgi:halimadienyl-diphosphate synthase